MPGRKIPLVNNEIYHVFNRGIDFRPTFLNKRAFKRARETVNFYRFASTPVRYSMFLVWSKERKEELFRSLEAESDEIVDILSFCFMPNHFHFLLRQKADNGIARFMSNFQNSYTHYFNTRSRRTGPLFLDQFKAVRIEIDEQLLHVSRYIHLNPYTSFVVKTIKELKNYPWSSLPEFLGLQKGFCQPGEILAFFGQNSKFSDFLFNQADYQRRLDKIKHLILEV